MNNAQKIGLLVLLVLYAILPLFLKNYGIYLMTLLCVYLMAAFGVTLAPLLEELFFRGMLYPLLRRAWGVAVGVIITGGAFASIHAQQLGYSWGPMLTIFAVGVVFTLVRERTNSVAR